MSWLSRLSGMIRKDSLDREIEEELRSHVEMRAADSIASGTVPEEAQFEAHRRFGNVGLIKQATRAVDLIGWLESLGQNLRYATRMLRRSPGFTTVAVLTLALGIGGNVALFTVVQAVLLKPLPYSHPEQLVRIYDDLRGLNTNDIGMSVPEMWDLRDKSGVFEELSALVSVDANLTGGDQPERIELMGTSPEYFTMIGTPPQLGRVYTKQDAQPGFTSGVVISDTFWKRSFGRDPGVLGKKIRADGDFYTVIGVMPAGFRHPGRTITNDVDVWAAAGFMADPFPAPPLRATRLLPGSMGRLKPGLTLDQGQARLEVFVRQLAHDYPDEYPAATRWGVRLVSIQEDIVGKVRTELFVLFGAVAFVLLIACVNLANLLLARAASRQGEIAIRLAVGAGRGRLIAQLLTESMLLATLSGVVALFTVYWTKTLLLRFAAIRLPRLNEVSISPGVLLFAFLLSLLTGIVFGLAPALKTASMSQVTKLREGSHGSGSSRQQMKISRVLVVSEIALSLVLLIGTGLLLRSFWHLASVRPGFEPHGITTTKVWLSVPNNPAQNPYLTPAKRGAFYREVLHRVSALPGVEAAALGTPNSLPLDSNRFQITFSIENRPLESERMPEADSVAVSPGYFDVLRTPLVRGRVFADSDNFDSGRVALIDETLARRYWPNHDPVGQHIQRNFPGGPNQKNPWITIVGVVGDTKLYGLDTPTSALIYLPLFQTSSYGSVVYVRTAGEPSGLGEAVRREVQAIDPSIPVFGLRSMDEVVGNYLAERRFALDLLGVFAVIALSLAAIGVYGVMAYTFSRRRNEIGIRVAMGAQRHDILKIAVGEGATLVLFGVVAGVIGAALLTRVLQSMLFEVKPIDPLTYGGITALLAGVTLLACLVPARRAAQVDPLIALRQE